MRGVFIVCVQVALITWGSPSDAATDLSGSLQICRPKGIVTSFDRQDISISAGTHFVDVGTGDPKIDTGDNNLPVDIRTSEAATLKHERKCVAVAAIATVGSPGLLVRPGNHRAYRFSGAIKGGGNGVEDLNAVPASVFK